MSERMTRRAVAQYVFITLTSKDARNVRMIRVMRSPNEDASGVAILSVVSRQSIGLPGLRRNRLESRINADVKVLSTTLDRLAPSMALTIIKALSNHVSRWGRVKYPSIKANSPAAAPMIRVYR